MYLRSYLWVPRCQVDPPVLVLCAFDALHFRSSHQSASAASQKKPNIAITTPIILPVVSFWGELDSEVVGGRLEEEVNGTGATEMDEPTEVWEIVIMGPVNSSDVGKSDEAEGGGRADGEDTRDDNEGCRVTLELPEVED